MKIFNRLVSILKIFESVGKIKLTKKLTEKTINENSRQFYLSRRFSTGKNDFAKNKTK